MQIHIFIPRRYNIDRSHPTHPHLPIHLASYPRSPFRTTFLNLVQLPLKTIYNPIGFSALASFPPIRSFLCSSFSFSTPRSGIPAFSCNPPVTVAAPSATEPVRAPTPAPSGARPALRTLPTGSVRGARRPPEIVSILVAYTARGNSD